MISQLLLNGVIVDSIYILIIRGVTIRHKLNLSSRYTKTKGF